MGGQQHEVGLIVEGLNDEDSPILRIVQICLICRVQVSERIVDIRESKGLETVTANAYEDGEAWLRHCGVLL